MGQLRIHAWQVAACLHKLRNQTVARCLASWMAHAAEQRLLRLKMQRCIAALGQRHLVAAFHTWKASSP